jgi:hypothetical protein
MKFRLSHLFVAIAFFAVISAWLVDRSRLTKVNAELNSECIELFARQPELIDVSTNTLLNTGGIAGRKLMYDATDPVDRNNYYRGLPPKILDVHATLNQPKQKP